MRKGKVSVRDVIEQQVLELFELAERSRKLGDTLQANLIQESAEEMCREYGIKVKIPA